ncbi:regulator [Vibrio metoecus]|uniref:Regulator n=1 Tax=Vibrio metoecus TaxID=1481663 RepID=A0A0N8VB94_VIBMT|nr:phage protein [Vibrio metoecus]KQB03363.1 regulator [Vibrio metoecus]
MNRNEMTKNFVFREFECGLSVEDAAKLCFKTVREVKQWDAGKKIPPICKRLMRWHSRKELYYGDEWWGFKMEGGRLILPTGDRVAPQQILAAIAILQIEAPSDAITRSKLLKYARAMAKIKGIK